MRKMIDATIELATTIRDISNINFTSNQFVDGKPTTENLNPTHFLSFGPKKNYS